MIASVCRWGTITNNADVLHGVFYKLCESKRESPPCRENRPVVLPFSNKRGNVGRISRKTRERERERESEHGTTSGTNRLLFTLFSLTWSQMADGGAQAPRIPCRMVRTPASSFGGHIALSSSEMIMS